MLAQTPTTPTTATSGLQFPNILLALIVFISFIGFLVVMFLPDRTDEERGRVRTIGLAASGLQFFLAAIFGMLVQVGLAEGGGVSSANEENYNWTHSFSFTSTYHLAADGISLTLLVLCTLLFVCVFFHSWKVREHVRLYIALMLLLETSVNGVLCSGDYVLFLIFWGMQILPLYLMLRVFGGPARARAAGRYLAFSLTSLGLLAGAVILVVARAGQHTSDITGDFHALLGPVQAAGFWLSFAAFAIAFGVFPVHRWRIDAQSEAAPGVAAVISSMVTTLGAYGMIRIGLGQFPGAAHQYSLVMVGLAVVGAVWGGLGALAQDDVRRFIGYSSLAQLSLVLLGIGAHTSVALEGAVLLLVAHGVAVTMLTLLSGSLEERTRTRSLRGYGGLVAQVPRLAGFWMFAVFTAIGVPLLAGFVAEFMLFSGAFPAHRIATAVVMASLAVTTGGLVWTAHRIFFGPVRETLSRVRDASTLELAYLLPLVALVLLFGIRPGAVTPVLTNGVIQITTRLAGG